MDRGRSGRHPNGRNAAAFLKPHLVYASMGAPLLLLSTIVPAPLFLPVLSLLAIASAAAVGLFAWHVDAARVSPGVTSWDVSGALALIGIAAGMLSEPANVVDLFGLVPMS